MGRQRRQSRSSGDEDEVMVSVWGRRTKRAGAAHGMDVGGCSVRSGNSLSREAGQRQCANLAQWHGEASARCRDLRRCQGDDAENRRRRRRKSRLVGGSWWSRIPGTQSQRGGGCRDGGALRVDHGAAHWAHAAKGDVAAVHSARALPWREEWQRRRRTALGRLDLGQRALRDGAEGVCSVPRAERSAAPGQEQREGVDDGGEQRRRWTGVVRVSRSGAMVASGRVVVCVDVCRCVHRRRVTEVCVSVRTSHLQAQSAKFQCWRHRALGLDRERRGGGQGKTSVCAAGAGLDSEGWRGTGWGVDMDWRGPG